MQQTTTKWEPSRLLVMEKWKTKNNATAKKTAEHFKVDTKGYVLARQRHLISKGLINKNGAKPTHSKSKSKVIELTAPEATRSNAIALILIKPEQLTTILGDLWA